MSTHPFGLSGDFGDHHVVLAHLCIHFWGLLGGHCHLGCVSPTFSEIRTSTFYCQKCEDLCMASHNGCGVPLLQVKRQEVNMLKQRTVELPSPRSLNKVVCWAVSFCFIMPEILCRDDNRNLLEEHVKKHRCNASEHFRGGRKQPKYHDHSAQGSVCGSGGEE